MQSAVQPPPAGGGSSPVDHKHPTLYSGSPQLNWCSGSPQVRPQLAGGASGHSVYTLPSFASAAECDALIAESATLMETYQRSEADGAHSYQCSEAICRLPLACGLESTLLHRLLAFIESQMPALALAAFGQASGLAEMDIAFARGEPAVNVYTAGGHFAPHTDSEGDAFREGEEVLTMLVPLSPPGAFEGGGTAFWGGSHIDRVRRMRASCSGEHYDVSNERNWLPHDHAVHAPAGTAIVFGGEVTHAGLPVTTGTRHLLVVSFTLRPW